MGHSFNYLPEEPPHSVQVMMETLVNHVSKRTLLAVLHLNVQVLKAFGLRTLTARHSPILTVIRVIRLMENSVLQCTSSLTLFFPFVTLSVSVSVSVSMFTFVLVFAFVLESKWGNIFNYSILVVCMYVCTNERTNVCMYVLRIYVCMYACMYVCGGVWGPL